ncbi:hypothetical protein B0H13DRAFT_1660243 [Mycena leptocephala]|nr:hypothetical protein B0H13DRAFT_1660243 [Mycena leptocephala]
MTGPLDSTYGAWFISLFLETILYGMGILQAWLYFHWYPADGWSTKLSVLLVTTLETVQIVFFFASSYSRFVDHFGLQLLANVGCLFRSILTLLMSRQKYLSAFAVQMYRLCQSSPARADFHLDISRIAYAFVAYSLGTRRDVEIQDPSFGASSNYTDAISTLQCAAALMCDILITLYLCVVLHNAKTGIESTNSMLDTLIVNAINRGMLTALASAFTMVLFVAMPGTLYFFLSLALSSKLYMNSMFASLNSRQHIRTKGAATWNSLDTEGIALPTTSRASREAPPVVSNVRFDAASPSSVSFPPNSIVAG